MELYNKSGNRDSDAKMTDNEPATQKQVNRLYAVLHSLNIDPKEFKKDQHIRNLEDLTRRQISDWIDTLEADEAAAKDTPPKVETMSDCFREAKLIIDQHFSGMSLNDNTRAQIITQTAIELREKA